MLQSYQCLQHFTWPQVVLNTAPLCIPTAPKAPALLDKKKAQALINLLGKEARAAESIVVCYRQDLSLKALGLTSAAASPGGNGSAGRPPQQGCSDGGILQCRPHGKAAA